MLTQERVKELFDYDPRTGELISKGYQGRLKKGDRAGHLSKRGYRRLGVDGGSYREHRVIWLHCNGAFPNDQIDHINGVKDDNRICNLRDVTNKENHRNKKLSSRNTSGALGVSYCKIEKKWRAYIQLEKSKWLGNFTCKKDAITAREEAEIKYGYHENHGRA